MYVIFVAFVFVIFVAFVFVIFVVFFTAYIRLSMNNIEPKSDSDITIHSGPDIDDNFDDSPLPRACKEPLAIRTQRRIADSKIQSQRIRKNCQRQQQQYMIRLAGWMFQEGQNGRLSKEAVDDFVSKQINLDGLDMTLTKAVQHL